MIDTNALRKLCKSATPGPWDYCIWDNDSYEIMAGEPNAEGTIDGPTVVEPDASDEEGYGGVKRFDDAKFISAANPATVLALLDEVENTRKAMNAAKNVIKSQELTISHMRSKADRNNEAVTTLDSERAANAAMTDERDAMIETMHHMRAELEKLRTVEAAARNLAKVKGRHNSEIAMNQLLEALK